MPDIDITYLQDRLLKCKCAEPCLCPHKYDLLARYAHAGIPKLYWGFDPAIKEKTISAFKDINALEAFIQRGFSAAYSGDINQIKPLLCYVAKKLLILRKQVRCYALEDLARFFGHSEDTQESWKEFVSLDALIIFDLMPTPGFIQTKIHRLIGVRQDNIKSTFMGTGLSKPDLIQTFGLGQSKCTFLSA